MDASSSEGSADEEEILENFDKEAKNIIQTDTLPKKSCDRYLLVYNTYKKWREENKNSLSSSEENNLIVYFETLKAKLKPPSLWSIWSMLRKTLSAKEDINISHFINLKSIIKTNARGYKPKKAYVLRWKQIMEFMNNSPNNTYLAMKVILIFGICGCLRCDEITNIKVADVEDLGDKYIVSINSNKNEYAGQFIIGNLFYDIVKSYISLRPADQFSDRFFIKYREGKCFRQTIGRHSIGEVPEKIASYLQLPNAKRYTGHCFRRTSATLLSDSGANMQMVKQLGRWRSDIIAQGYIENSMHNRQLIYNGVIQKHTKDTHSEPSASAPITIENENDKPTYILNWSDFDDDFDSNNPVPDPMLEPIPNETIGSDFTTANNNKIRIPVTGPNEPVVRSGTSFLNKPGIKLNFMNQPTAQLPACNKKKRNEHVDDQNNNDIGSTLKKHNLQFDNGTFNNCVFNITICNCNKENNSAK